jgi:hypothetical protein
LGLRRRRRRFPRRRQGSAGLRRGGMTLETAVGGFRSVGTEEQAAIWVEVRVHPWVSRSPSPVVVHTGAAATARSPPSAAFGMACSRADQAVRDPRSAIRASSVPPDRRPDFGNRPGSWGRISELWVPEPLAAGARPSRPLRAFPARDASATARPPPTTEPPSPATVVPLHLRSGRDARAPTTRRCARFVAGP